MKNLFVLFLLAVCLAAGMSVPALGATRKLERTRIQGKDYVRLADWTRANGFQWRWIKWEETLQATNRAARLNFAVDSCAARINGVQVSLLFPVAYRYGSVYLSQLDVDTTLQPLLSPPQNPSGARIKTICLDPGHGGKDSGERIGSQEEKKYTLLIAYELREQLKRAGFKVVVTRTTDRFVELPDRTAAARRGGADLFVSLHFNATESGRNEVKGSEVYCLTPAGAPSTNARGAGADSGRFAGNRFNEKNLLLAYQVQKALVSNLPVEDRGVKRARYAVLRDAAMPAVLVEAGFMSHPSEGKKIFDPAYRRDMAQAILEGILAYKRIVERAS